MSGPKEYHSYQPKQLPNELIREIIANVANDGPMTREVFRTLVTASLVTRTWNALCRPYIFHTITISSKDANTRLSFLHFDAPHISQHIRALTLHRWPFDSCVVEEWFPECLGRLKSLRVLHFESRHNFNLANAPAPLTAGIMAMLSAPHLRKLVLRDWNFTMGASEFLSVLSATLEELVIQDVSTRGSEERDSPAIRLEALRSLELIGVSYSLLGIDHFIKCPNVQSFTVQWPREQFMKIPLWLLDNLLKLRLRIAPAYDIPAFGTPIRPSTVVIDVSGHRSCSDLFRRTKECIDSLPFASYIQTLTLNIEHKFFVLLHTEGLYPEVSDYLVLSRCLQQLADLGELKSISFNIQVDAEVSSMSDYLDTDEARERAKLRMGFRSLLEAHVLKAVFRLRRVGPRVLETAMHVEMPSTRACGA